LRQVSNGLSEVFSLIWLIVSGAAFATLIWRPAHAPSVNPVCKSASFFETSVALSAAQSPFEQ